MIDTDVIERMVQEQIAHTVDEQVTRVLASESWLHALEQKTIKYTQSRIMAKFADLDTVPELAEAVKTSIAALFEHGKLPGIDQYVDATAIRQCVDHAVENLVQATITQLTHDSAWIEKIERLINQTMTDTVVAQLGALDITPVVKNHVDACMDQFRADMVEKFASTGIDDRATSCQLTVMDDTVVVENRLTARDINIVNAAVMQDLVVTGSVNIDNPSWNLLADGISDRTLARLSKEWKQTLVSQVADEIHTKGINFDLITMAGQPVIQGNTLTRHVTDSSLQTVGVLKTLQVQGETHLNNTLSVMNRRLGINTQSPEMALSIWDEEVSVVIGKHKAKQAYIGTSRDSSVVIGVNRVPHLEIDTDGLTTVKKLRVGLHRISHDTQVPGWAGTRGDIVFNASPGADRVFAWVCTGAHRWQTLKSAE
jgi:hypothetical protein